MPLTILILSRDALLVGASFYLRYTTLPPPVILHTSHPPSFTLLALTACPHTVPHFIPTAEDVVTVLGHPAVHTPSHSDFAKQSEHSPTAPDSWHVSRGNGGGRRLPSPTANIVVRSAEPSTFFRGPPWKITLPPELGFNQQPDLIVNIAQVPMFCSKISALMWV